MSLLPEKDDLSMRRSFLRRALNCLPVVLGVFPIAMAALSVDAFAAAAQAGAPQTVVAPAVTPEVISQVTIATGAPIPAR